MQQIIDQLKQQEDVLRTQLEQINGQAKSLSLQLAQIQGALKSLTANGPTNKPPNLTAISSARRKQAVNTGLLTELIRAAIQTNGQVSDEELFKFVVAEVNKRNLAKHGLRSNFDKLIRTILEHPSKSLRTNEKTA